MAYATGTATSHYDLLNKLKAFVTANGWSVLNFTDDGGETANGRGSVLNLQGPGNGGSGYVYVNISTVNSTLLPANGWQISTSLAYASYTTWGLQNSESPNCFFNLWSSPMNYWFFVNNRRIIVIAQISTTFVSMYAGFFLPWGNPAQYPNPLYVAGDFYEQVNWSTTNAGRRMMVDCGSGYTPASVLAAGGWVLDPNGNWCPVSNEILSGSANDQSQSISSPGLFCQVWPWAAGNGGGNADGNTDWAPNAGGQSFGGGLDLLIPTAQGERFVWPTQILYGSGPPLGTLDSVYATFGSGISATSTITVSGTNYLAFQNIARNSGNDFFLVEEA